jgi:hypothetical protein
MTTTVAAAMTTTTTGVCRGTTDRSAMTIRLHIAPSVIVASEKIDIRPRIPAVVTSVITVASVTAVHVTHTSRQESRQGRHQGDPERNLNSVNWIVRLVHTDLPFAEEFKKYGCS